MIHKIYANNNGFKAIAFKPGLNVILANAKEGSNKKDTRNGVGKTSLIRVMHFCLGADEKRSELPLHELHDWVFTIVIDVGNTLITASRSVSNAEIISINGAIENLPIPPEYDKDKKEYFYRNKNWKKLLGLTLFGVAPDLTTRYKPSPRTLLSYLIRNSPSAFLSPFQYFDKQKAWDYQLHNAFLLGLSWSSVSDMQLIKDKETANKALKAIAEGGSETKGELEAERVRLQQEVSHNRQALASFVVHPQYQSLQERVNTLTQKIHALINENFIQHKKLEAYLDSIQSERTATPTGIEKLYQEAGLCFPDTIKKTLEEAKNFHAVIIENRKSFLKAEISSLKNNISKNNANIEELSLERKRDMEILKTHGALDEFSLLQEQHIEKKEKLELIQSRLSAINNSAAFTQEMKAKKIEIETQMLRNYEESKSSWEQAVIAFNENSQALYNESGNLIIDISKSGYKFKVEIPRSNSEGIGKMKIFCYDLMLVEMLSKQGNANFLVHDSTLFDGVDSRQKARALLHAHEKSSCFNFQYICTFNSDMVPYEWFDSNFDFDDFVRLRLDDKDPEDGLFGFRFNE